MLLREPKTYENKVKGMSTHGNCFGVQKGGKLKSFFAEYVQKYASKDAADEADVESEDGGELSSVASFDEEDDDEAAGKMDDVQVGLPSTKFEGSSTPEGPSNFDCILGRLFVSSHFSAAGVVFFGVFKGLCFKPALNKVSMGWDIFGLLRLLALFSPLCFQDCSHTSSPCKSLYHSVRMLWLLVHCLRVEKQPALFSLVMISCFFCLMRPSETQV